MGKDHRDMIHVHPNLGALCVRAFDPMGHAGGLRLMALPGTVAERAQSSENCLGVSLDKPGFA
jgi:hypothetical protein